MNETESQNNPADAVSGVQLPAGFEVLEVIGAGAHSIVYKAVYKLLCRLVAVKVIKSDSSDDMHKQIGRMQGEAKALAKLSHRNIVQVYQAGFTLDGHPFLVCEYLEGLTLQDWLRQHKTLSEEAIFDIFPQILDALQFAHENGFLHRDIKPSNVMLRLDAETGHFNAKLLDFGIARDLEIRGSEGITATGALSGSPAYMSPEQCKAEQLDLRSDLYSLACVLYECIYGQAPFTADSAFAVMHRHVYESIDLEMLKKQDRGFGLEDLLAAALSRDACLRPQSAGEFKALLNKASGRRKSKKSTVLYVVSGALLLGLTLWGACKLAGETDSHKISPVTESGYSKISKSRSRASIEHRLTDLYRRRSLVETESGKKEMLAELDELMPLTSNKRSLRFAAFYLRANLLQDPGERQKNLQEALELCRTADQKEPFEAAYCYYLLSWGERTAGRYEKERTLLAKAWKLKEHSESNGAPGNLELPKAIEQEMNSGFQSNLLLALGRNAKTRKDYISALKYYEYAENRLNTMEPSAWALQRLEQASLLEYLGKSARARQMVAELLSGVSRQAHGNPPEDLRQATAFFEIARWQYRRQQLDSCHRTLVTGLATVKRSMPQDILKEQHKAAIARLETALAQLNSSKKVDDWDRVSESED